LLKRNFIGMEIAEEYFQVAKERIANASLAVPVLKRAVADFKKHEESREQQQDDGPIKAPEPCFFSNMTEDQLDKIFKED